MRAPKHLTIGIAGHPGHGKSSLAAHITGRHVVRAVPEKVSFRSGRTEILEWRPGPGRHPVSLMDVPGHPRLFKNTIRGLSGADLAILVVAADDGVMPQTREHIKMIHHLSISKGIIVLSKADLADAETLGLAALDIEEAVCHTVLADMPVMPFSAVTGEGGELLVSRILEIMESVSGKSKDDNFRMWIDEFNGILGFGTVARGVVGSGTLSQDDSLWLLPSGRETRARSMEVHHRKTREVQAGQRAGVSLPKIALKDIQRGMVLVKQKPEALFAYLNAEITADADIQNRQRVKICVGTSVVNALLVLMETSSLPPGRTGLAQFRVKHPLPVIAGDRILICGLNTHAVIGGGKVLEACNEKFRAVKSKRLVSYLRALRNGDQNAAILYYVQNRSHRLVPLSEVILQTGIPAGEVQAAVRALLDAGALVECSGECIFAAENHRRLMETVFLAVSSFFAEDPLKNAVAKDEIRKAADMGLDDEVLKFMLDGLCDQHRLVKVKGGYRISGFVPGLNADQRRVADMLIKFSIEIGPLSFSPEFFRIKHPDTRKYDIQKVLDFLHGQGTFIRLNDGHYLYSEMLDEIKARVAFAIDGKGSLRLSDSMAVLGYGRSNAAAVYEYLDEIGFTRRNGNERRLADGRSR